MVNIYTFDDVEYYNQSTVAELGFTQKMRKVLLTEKPIRKSKPHSRGRKMNLWRVSYVDRIKASEEFKILREKTDAYTNAAIKRWITCKEKGAHKSEFKIKFWVQKITKWLRLLGKEHAYEFEKGTA